MSASKINPFGLAQTLMGHRKAGVNHAPHPDWGVVDLLVPVNAVAMTNWYDDPSLLNVMASPAGCQPMAPIDGGVPQVRRVVVGNAYGVPYDVTVPSNLQNPALIYQQPSNY